MPLPIEKFKAESGELQREARERIVGYIVAAFGLIAGLAWNDAIKSLIEYLAPQNQNTLLAKFVYAAFISVVVVIISVYLLRLAKKRE